MSYKIWDYKEQNRRYRQTDKFRRDNNFGIYVVVVTIVLLLIFG